jgi:hypothetical protein
MAESGYAHTLGHLQRALPTPLLLDGREVLIGSLGTAYTYRYVAYVEQRERETVLRPADVQQSGAFLRQREEAHR